MNSRIQIAIGVTLGVLLILGGAVFVGTQYIIPNLVDRQGGENATTTDASLVFLRSQYETATSAHNRLKSENVAYAQANQLRVTGKYADAAVAYRSALVGVTDVAENAEIKFWLAYSDAASGNYVDAIATYKELAAASTTLSRVTRAHAVQNLAHMFYRFGDPVITREIFKDEPYRSLWVPNRVSLSYRHVFDYAASLHPLALSETYSADWYADRLLAGTTTRPEYKVIIREKLELAEKNMASVRDDPTQRNTFLNAFEKRAEVLGKMRRIGDTSFADPDEAFKELLKYAETYRLSDGTPRLQYAYYLSNMYGKERAAEVQSVLAPIIADPDGHGVVVAHLLRAGPSRSSIVNQNVTLLASIDPAFRKTLLSFGWTEKDLQTN